MRIQKEQYDMYGVDGDVNYDISMDKIEKVMKNNIINNFILDIVILIPTTMLIMLNMLNGQWKQFQLK